MAEQRQWFGEMPVAQDAEVAQADMIERLRACVAEWLAGRTPQTAARFYELMAETETRPAMRQRMVSGAKALRALQPGDLGHFE